MATARSKPALEITDVSPEESAEETAVETAADSMSVTSVQSDSYTHTLWLFSTYFVDGRW